ncbi:MAG TPA: tryptophan synthase subunit alpha [Gemmatimonadales bacterium]|nr:tryptophan synthase subunit alpha [Gemmatimonadales bacterium]
MALSLAISSSDPFVTTFEALRARRRAALVPYLTAGFPDRATSLAALRAADRWGDILEVGVPFSDPLADGPTIQRSSHAALLGGMTLAGTLDLVREAAPRHPVVLFTYLNPVLAYGLPQLLHDAAGAGASGLLLTDLPVGADPAIEQTIAASPLALVPLVAPTTPDARLAAIGNSARGFLYLVARLGVTGASPQLASDLAEQVARVRRASDRPVAVGFGIAEPAQARSVAALADGVVVGSALVEALERDGVAGLEARLAALHAAMERPA